MSVKRASFGYLSWIMKRVGKHVPPGLWLHKKSGVKYHVHSLKVLDEKTLNPMIVYSPLESHDIKWARSEKDFLKKFKKIDV